MPRVNLTEQEAAMLEEWRRKTEIDRTHNAALETAAHAIAKHLAAKDGGVGQDLVEIELQAEFTSALEKHARTIRHA